MLGQRFGEQFAVPEDRVFVGLDAYQKALSCDVDVATLRREASYCGQVVSWNELAAKGPDLFPKEKLAWESSPPVLPDKQGFYARAVALPGIYRPY